MTGDTTDAVAAANQPLSTRPMIGAEYLESLRNGREVWLYGERVASVTTHPAFRNTARMIARLYDALSPRIPAPVAIPIALSGPRRPGKSNSPRATPSPPGRA